MTVRQWRLVSLLGVVIFIIGLVVFGYTFYPVISQEVSYRFNSRKEAVVVSDGLDDTDIDSNRKEKVIPVNTEFSVVVPKIRANAPVVKNVDPFSPDEYQRQLSKGIAHADGSSLPGKPGTTFLFAHSSTDFLTASRYNSVFYLLNKVEVGDQIVVMYQNRLYEYKVQELEVVEPDQVQFLTQKSGPEKLVLMTCNPPGTTFKRLLVHASRN